MVGDSGVADSDIPFGAELACATHQAQSTKPKAQRPNYHERAGDIDRGFAQSNATVSLYWYSRAGGSDVGGHHFAQPFFRSLSSVPSARLSRCFNQP